MPPMRKALALLVALLSCAAAAPTINPSQMDGTTTYCYRQSSKPSGSAAAQFAYQGDACPVQLAIRRTTPGNATLVNHNVEYDLVATARLKPGNGLGVTSFEPAARNRNGSAVQIFVALVYGCDGTVMCDLINEAVTSPVSKTDDGTANFTDSKATFHANLTFATPGTKNIIGFLVLPPQDSPLKENLHFVVFSSLDVVDPNAAPTATPAPTAAPETKASSSSGMPIGTIIVIIVVVIAVAAVAFFVYKRIKRNRSEMVDNYRSTVSPPHKALTQDPYYSGGTTTTMEANSVGPDFYPTVATKKPNQEDQLLRYTNSPPEVSPRGGRDRDVVEDMTFQLPDSSDSEASFGTGQTMEFAGVVPPQERLPAEYELATATGMTINLPQKMSRQDRESANSDRSLGTGQVLDFVETVPPAERVSVDSDTSMGTVEFAGSAPSPMAVPSPDGTLYSVVDGSAYYLRQNSGDDQTIQLQSTRSGVTTLDGDAADESIRTVQIGSMRRQ